MLFVTFVCTSTKLLCWLTHLCTIHKKANVCKKLIYMCSSNELSNFEFGLYNSYVTFLKCDNQIGKIVHAHVDQCENLHLQPTMLRINKRA